MGENINNRLGKTSAKAGGYYPQGAFPGIFRVTIIGVLWVLVGVDSVEAVATPDWRTGKGCFSMDPLAIHLKRAAFAGEMATVGRLVDAGDGAIPVPTATKTGMLFSTSGWISPPFKFLEDTFEINHNNLRYSSFWLSLPVAKSAIIPDQHCRIC